MINGIRVKICGLTTLVDADLADSCGADYLGFILHAKSPRYLPLESFKAMSARLPPRKTVAVSVAPSEEELIRMHEAGFDFFQIHFPVHTPFLQIAAWSKIVGHQQLWLAPKLPPDEEIDPAWLPLAASILWDTYKPETFGGSGETSDWGKFKRSKETYPNKTWILAGGLNPDNIAAAIQATDARVVDVNSGVEAMPGIKDPEKLKRFFVALHESTKRSNPAY